MQKNKKIYKQTFFKLSLIFPIIIVAEFYQFNMLWGNAFGITGRMLSWLHTNYIPTDNSYAFPLMIHRLFKFLPFNTIFEWAVFWALIMNLVFFIVLLKRYSKYSLKEYIFIYASMFILDVFVFNINKDIVQCLMILIIYEISLLNIKQIWKLIIICGILIFESVYFRSYYIFAALSILIVYFVFNHYIKKNKVNYLNASLLIILFLFLAIFISQYIDSEAYYQLLTRRDTLEEDLVANTVINNIVPGSSYFIYCINYIINMIRMLFPFELVVMGIKYLPFFIYQIYLTINIIKGMKKLNKESCLNISIVIGYWLMLFASESDFGTLVRHQAILLPFYLDLIKNNMDKEKEKGDNYEKN